MEEKKVPALRFRGFDNAWEQHKVRDLTNVLSASRVHKSEWMEKGVPFFRSSDVVAAYKGIENEMAYISHELFEELANLSGRLEKDDLLITGGGSIGVPYIVPDNKPLYSKDADLIWVKHSEKFASEYLYTYFICQRFRNYIGSISHVGTIAHYTIEQVKNTPVLMPYIDEQREIGSFFSSLNHLISLHQRKLEMLKKVKKSMLEKMFPKNDAKVPEVRFSDFTDAWEQHKVRDLTNVLSASRVHKSEWMEKGVPFFRSSDVVAAYKGIENEMAYISHELFEELANLSGRLEKDDLLITGGGSIGVPYIVPDNKPLYSKDADLIWVKHSEKFASEYLYTYFICQRFRNYIGSISHVGTIAHYTIEQVKNTPVLMPYIDEQREIGSFFSSLNHLISLHQRKLEKLKNIKKSMLEKMFII